MKAAANLDQLLYESRHLSTQLSGLTASAAEDSLLVPSLQRGLEQIESLSLQLAEKTGTIVGSPSITIDSKANLLLATKGFDVNKAEQVLAKVSDISFASFEPNSLPNVNVDDFVQYEYEASVLNIITDFFHQSRNEVENSMTKRLEASWEKTKRILLECRQTLPSSTTSSSVDGSNYVNPTDAKYLKSFPSIRRPISNPKVAIFSNLVHRINECRNRNISTSPAFHFSKAIKNLDSDLKIEQLIDCWLAISTITQEQQSLEENVFKASENSSLSSVYHSPYESAENLKWRRLLVNGSRKFLEEMFLRFVDKTLAQYPRDAFLGGRPSTVEKIRSFVNVKFKRMAPGEIEKLDIISGVPIWMLLFYLIRSGLLKETLGLVQTYELQIQRLEPAFLSYLKSFVEAEDYLVDNNIRAQIRSNYSQQMFSARSDPFKLALFKLIGRCDMAKKHVPDAIQTSEDYLWFQLWLVRETSSHLPNEEMYCLRDLQNSVSNFGPSYFDPRGNNPLKYFQILLLTGQFETAIGFMHETQFHADAVHFAIVLAYHQVLHLVPKPDPALWDTIVCDRERANSSKGAHPQVNFAVLLDNYAREVAFSDKLESFQYLFLITIPNTVEYDTFARERVRELVLQSGDFTHLLGDISQDGSIVEGHLSKYMKLLHLTDSDAFIKEITTQTANKCEKDGQYHEAMQLYNIAGEYNHVLKLLCTQLASYFSGPFILEEFQSKLQITSSILEYYTSHQQILTTLDKGLIKSVQDFSTLLQARIAYEAGNWNVALSLLDSLHILPTSTDVAVIARHADEVKRLPELISSNLSQMLLLAMNALYHTYASCKELAFVDAGRQSLAENVRKQARALMLFVGMVRLRVNSDVCAHLTRLDIAMNEGA